MRAAARSDGYRNARREGLKAKRMYLHYIIEVNANDAEGSRNRCETEIIQGDRIIVRRWDEECTPK